MVFTQASDAEDPDEYADGFDDDALVDRPSLFDVDPGETRRATRGGAIEDAPRCAEAARVRWRGDAFKHVTLSRLGRAHLSLALRVREEIQEIRCVDFGMWTSREVAPQLAVACARVEAARCASVLFGAAPPPEVVRLVLDFSVDARCVDAHACWCEDRPALSLERAARRFSLSLSLEKERRLCEKRISQKKKKRATGFFPFLEEVGYVQVGLVLEKCAGGRGAVPS